jgi:hypothetical protein
MRLYNPYPLPLSVLLAVSSHKGPGALRALLLLWNILFSHLANMLALRHCGLQLRTILGLNLTCELDIHEDNELQPLFLTKCELNSQLCIRASLVITQLNFVNVQLWECDHQRLKDKKSPWCDTKSSGISNFVCLVS